INSILEWNGFREAQSEGFRFAVPNPATNGAAHCKRLYLKALSINFKYGRNCYRWICTITVDPRPQSSIDDKRNLFFSGASFAGESSVRVKCIRNIDICAYLKIVYINWTFVPINNLNPKFNRPTAININIGRDWKRNIRKA